MGCSSGKQAGAAQAVPAAAAPAEPKPQEEPAALLLTSGPQDAAAEKQPSGASVEAEQPAEKAAVVVAEAAKAEEQAAEPVTLKVEILEASDLRHENFGGKKAAVCSVEIAGKPESKQQTAEAAKGSAAAPQWDHKLELPGYRLGEALVFTLQDGLGSATLDAERVRAGYIGTLELSVAGEGVKGLLKVNVEGADPTLGESADHLADKAGLLAEDVKDAVQVADKAKEQLEDVAREAVEDAKELAQEAKELVEDAATEAKVVVEEKMVTCTC